MTSTYYKLSPDEIVNDIIQTKEIKKVVIKESEYLVYPNVYPSERFRSTNFILDSLQSLLPGVALCDMGCGMGIIGLFAMKQGAKHVVQVDVNPLAIQNARANRDLYHYSSDQLAIIESNCFDHVPKQYFDIIVFNIPFHSEPYHTSNPLEHAFHDPNFASTKKFLKQAVNYCTATTQIFIAFSSKGNILSLEKLFDESGLNWILWKIKNTDQEFDNRLYELKMK